jgi:hypothetical protein
MERTPAERDLIGNLLATAMNPNHGLDLQPHEEDPRFDAYIELQMYVNGRIHVALPNGESYICPPRVCVAGHTFTDEQKGLIRLIHAGYNFDESSRVQIQFAVSQAKNMRDALRLVRIQRTGWSEPRLPGSDLTHEDRNTGVGLVHYDTGGPDYMQLPNGKRVELDPLGGTARMLQRTGLSRLYLAGYNFSWRATLDGDVRTAAVGNTMAEAIRLTEQQFCRMRRLTSTMSASAAAAAVIVMRESPKRPRDANNDEEVGDEEEEEESKSQSDSDDDDRSVHGLDGAPSTHRTKKKNKVSHETDKRLSEEEEAKIALALKGSQYITVRHGPFMAQLPRTRKTLVYAVFVRNVLGVSEEELEKRGDERDTVVLPLVDGLTLTEFLLFICGGVAAETHEANSVQSLVRQLTLAGAMGVDRNIAILTDKITARLHELASEEVLEIGIRFCNESWLRHAALKLCTSDIKTKLPPHTILRLAPFWREEAGNPMCTRIMQITQEQRFLILHHAWRQRNETELELACFDYSSLSTDDTIARALYKEVNSVQNQQTFSDWMKRVGTCYARVKCARLPREYFQFAEEQNRTFIPPV